MFQAEPFITRIQEADHGTPRMEILMDAIREADAASDHYWRIYFRYEYIRESIFHEDNFKSIIMFPTLLQVFDEHPELQDDTYDDVMQAFKWVLENMADYHQISCEEIERYYDEYENRCKQFGFSMRVYYMKKSKYYLPINQKKAKELYQKFRTCKRDANSDCEACEINNDMTFALEFGEEEEALRIAAPILDGRKRCGEIPHVTCGVLTKYYLYHDNLTEAAYYGRLCERYTQNEPEFLAESGYLLELYSAIDPSAGWKIFKRNVLNFTECRNPLMKMTFARGAYRLLQCIAKRTEYSESVFLKPLPVKPTKEGWRITDLIDYFYGIAEEHCTLLDKRNGTSYYMDYLEKKLPKADGEEAVPDQFAESCHGLVAKIPCTLAAVPASEEHPALTERLSGLSEKMELISHDEEENAFYVVIRFEDKIYEVSLLWMNMSEYIHARPHNALNEETYKAMMESRQHLLLQMTHSDDPSASLHVAMHLLHTLLPDMLGVIDMVAAMAYPASWVEFAGTFRNAVKPADLFGLNIVGSEDSNEIWMSTQGLATLGLRELEIIGANRANFGYFADILHYTGCRAAEAAMLGDAGSYITSLRLEQAEYDLTWAKPEDVLADCPDSLAAHIERNAPAGILQVMDEDEKAALLTEFVPLAELPDVDLSGSHDEFVRRIFLAKETIGCFKNALSYKLEQAAVRLEFQISEEIRQECGYSKELLWAEITDFDGETITAVIAETSDLLPECHEGDTVTVLEENITGWFVRPNGTQSTFTEEQAFFFM